jgi:hypothetical protein
MKGGKPLSYDNRRMATCLESQARLCDRIAVGCWDEVTAQKYKRMATECRQAAAKLTADAKEENQESTVRAQWPPIMAF